jgi:hypothetical protein
MTRITTTFVSLVLTHLALSAAAHVRQPAEGPEAQPPEQPEPQAVVRTYNVADLMRTAVDYPLDSQIVPPTGYGAGGAPGGGMFVDAAAAAPKPAAHAASLDELITLITDFVDSNSWQANGGSVGSVRGFGALLVIAQTEDNHAKIAQLLDEVRRNTGPSQVVSVRATWLLMNPPDVPNPGTVATAEWVAGQPVYCEGRTVCFSGQTVHVTSGRGRAVINDLTPIVADSAVAFDPTVERVQSGVSLQVAPQLVPGTETAIVDLQSFASEWGDAGQPVPVRGAVTTQPSAGAAAGAGAEVSSSVDRLNILAQEMKTTLRVPLGKKFVVGGMTLDPAAGEKDTRQLCLILEISAVK